MIDYEIVQMTELNVNDINIPNQAFEVYGKLEPTFRDRKWTFIEVMLQTPYECQFPNDDIDYSEYIHNPDKVVFLAYINSLCAGQIRIRKNWNGFCFIEDIAVGKEFRNKGIAVSLLKEAEKWAKELNLKGFMLEAQDYNLNACRLYHKNGFVLGSVDNMLYYNTGDKANLALFWYKTFE